MSRPYHVIRIGASPIHEKQTVEYDEKQAASLGLTYAYTPCATEGDTIEALRRAEIVITRGNPVARPAIEAMENGLLIVCATVGFDYVDLAAAAERGIVVANTPMFCVDEVADHTMALLLSCPRGRSSSARPSQGRRWRKDLAAPMLGIKGQVLGLVGFGNIARRVAERARPFGLQLLAYDPYVAQEAADPLQATMVGLNELLERSDFVSCHIPLNAETRHLIGERQLRAMKSTAYLINTSRGAVIDEEALARALEQGWIAGAGLDVFEEEPLPADSPLLRLDNVVVTPHTGAYSETSVRLGWTMPWEIIRDILNGQWPSSVVSPATKQSPKAISTVLQARLD